MAQPVVGSRSKVAAKWQINAAIAATASAVSRRGNNQIIASAPRRPSGLVRPTSGNH